MASTTVELRFDDAGELERHFREHLSRGGAWLAGERLVPADACELVLIAGGARLALAARVVFADDAGTGLALDDFCAELRATIEDFVRAAAEAPAAEAPAAEPADDDDAPFREPLPKNIHERLRHLTPVEQAKIARSGETPERIVLERLYGKAVWEVLLHNQHLTHPEVARIARMGALPRPLIELIVGNAAWLKSPEVRRALLANPRLQADQIPRILRLLPKHELKLVPMQTAYPAGVRDAARRMLHGGDD